MRAPALLSTLCLSVSAVLLPLEVDWIVVGGGAAGCTAAAALADAKESVLVIERGPDDRHIPTSQSGDGWPRVVVDAVENIRWTDGAWGAVARVLGGGASVNDGYFFEETPEYIQELLQLDGQDLLSFYESSKYLADQLLTPLPPTRYGDAFAKAVETAGHGKADFENLTNIRYKDGAWVIRSLFNLTDQGKVRHTPARLLHDRAHLANLQVVTDTHVHKINFEGTRAVSVSVDGGATVKATRGILMAAGAVYTPQLLQISGVGGSALLSRLGVQQVVDLPGVGQNFVDRLTWTVQIAAPSYTEHFLGYTVAADSEAGITFESVGGHGVDNTLAIPSLGLAPVKQRDPALRPILQLLMEGPIGDIVGHMSNVVGLMHNVQSRGAIEAVSADASTPPRVTANYFNATGDLEKMVANLKLLIEVASQSSLAPWRVQKAFDPPTTNGLNESHANILKSLGISVDEQGIPDFLSCLFKTPGEKLGFITLPCLPEEDSKWGDFLRENVLSTYHYFGTAAVGQVVEPGSFRVQGTEGLYVIDASVIPSPLRVNPVGTIMTIGHFVGKKLANAATTRIIV